MEKHIFWTDETDRAILTWVKGKGKDDALYLEKVYFPLTYFARYIIGLYARDTRDYCQDKEVLCQELVSEASVKLLKDYDFKRATTGRPMPFIHSVMKSHIYILFQHSQRSKRKGKNVSIDELNSKTSSQDGDCFFDYIFWKEQGVEHTNINKDSVAFLVKWFKENADKCFRKKTAKKVLFIVDVIEHPEKHPIKDNFYTTYISKKCGFTRQRLQQLLKKMASKVKPYLDEYNGYNQNERTQTKDMV